MFSVSPCSYMQVNLCVWLAGSSEGVVDELAFELLIPKLILQRYVNLLLEHRRVILSGSSGTGKTYLARRLAQFLVERFHILLLFSEWHGTTFCPHWTCPKMRHLSRPVSPRPYPILTVCLDPLPNRSTSHSRFRRPLIAPTVNLFIVVN